MATKFRLPLHSAALVIHFYGAYTVHSSCRWLCFNAEVWPFSNSDAAYLEGVHFRL